MNQRWQLVTIICVVALITAFISHCLVAWLKIRTEPGGYWSVGPTVGKASAFLAGSSLAGDGIAWSQIAERVNLRIEGWGVAGSSPSEWERFQRLEKRTNQTILVVSAYDLNEYCLSDFHAQVVPLAQAVEDLWRSPMDWVFYKRVISDYPLTYLRLLFPSAGRSNGIIKGIREKVETYITSVLTAETRKSSTNAFTDPVSEPEIKKVHITNWSQNLMLRRLVGMRIACQGKHGFKGPKRLAFLRMLRYAQNQGDVLVVVLPVSRAYANEFLNPTVISEFEETLAEARLSVPMAHWVRLDLLKELNSDDNFYDLVHMNPDGQLIATEALINDLISKGYFKNLVHRNLEKDRVVRKVVSDDLKELTGLP
jgi:hypothetical protein